jgi:hypothetical protein
MLGMNRLTVDQPDYFDPTGRIAERPLLADPDFGSKARKSEQEATRPRIGYYEFLCWLRRGQALSCAEIPIAVTKIDMAIRLCFGKGDGCRGDYRHGDSYHVEDLRL